MKKIKVVKLQNGKISECFDTVAEECAINLFVNGAFVSSISASCNHYKELIYGYLFTERMISCTRDVRDFHLKEENGVLNFFAKVKPNEETFQTEKSGDIQSGEILITDKELFALLKELSKKSIIFENTGGTHIAALSDGVSLFSVFEDISRRSAVQKSIGNTLLFHNSLSKMKVLLTSARVNETIMRYAARAGIKIVASISAPTSRAVEIARGADITLIGFLREERMNIYSAPGRIKFTA